MVRAVQERSWNFAAGSAVLNLADIIPSLNEGAEEVSPDYVPLASVPLELSAIARLLWGKGAIGTRFHATPQLALCLRDHGLRLPGRQRIDPDPVPGDPEEAPD